MSPYIEIALFIVFFVVIGVVFLIKSARVICLHCGEKHTAGFKTITAVSPGNILFRDWFRCDNSKSNLWYYRDILRTGNTPVNSDTPWILTYVDPVSEIALVKAKEAYEQLHKVIDPKKEEK